jgi:crotonobetainyl-CoA:carnitine CoA-transferase CaiB-like acyl-CoA transferase
MSGGIYSCKGILAALFDRERTGRGSRVEISMFDAMLNLLGYIATLWLTKGELPKPCGSAHEYTVPWQAFQAQDGYVVVATREERFWRKLCDVMGHPEWGDDPRFATNTLRVANRDTLVPMIEAVFRERTVNEWLKVLRAAQVPASPVNHFDRAFAEPPVAEREMIVEYDHPVAGHVRLPGNPIKMSGVKKTPSTPAPLLGEHTESVLRDVLSLTPEAINKLRADGAIK